MQDNKSISRDGTDKKIASERSYGTLEVSFTFNMGLNGSTSKGMVSNEQGARFVSNFGKRTENFAFYGVFFFIVYKPRKVALP